MPSKDAVAQIAAIHDSAVVVIDVQNDFCSAGGAFERQGRNLEGIRCMLPTLSAFLDAARQLGVRILFVQHEHRPEQLTPFMRTRERLLFGGEGFPLPGTWGAELCREITPRPGEPIVAKYWYNAFSSPRFEQWLTEHNVRTLIFTGVLTNVCVETTLRNADTRDYHAMVVSDCVASDSAELHRATLANVSGYFGWVSTSRELLDLWTKGGK
jgi:ureidoacrylate peracid hydrolase